MKVTSTGQAQDFEVTPEGFMPDGPLHPKTTMRRSLFQMTNETRNEAVVFLAFAGRVTGYSGIR
jgi:hypothetical protein